MNNNRCQTHTYWIPRGEKIGTCIYCGQQKEFLDWDDIVATVIRRRNYGRNPPNLATIDKPARSILARKGANGCELGFNPRQPDPKKGFKVEEIREKTRK